jgi:hypothetical protein
MPERNDMDSLGLFSAPPSINIGYGTLFFLLIPRGHARLYCFARKFQPFLQTVLQFVLVSTLCAYPPVWRVCYLACIDSLAASQRERTKRCLIKGGGFEKAYSGKKGKDKLQDFLSYRILEVPNTSLCIPLPL